jgi:environmental stress-induced protein Ves
MRIIRKKEYKITTWRGGTTTEIYLYPEDGDYKGRQFDYRISTATIDTEESVFTVLPGIERVILPLENKMVLLHGEEEVVLSPYEAYRFPGDSNTRSRGINRDFNLMINHGKRGNVEILTISQDSSINEKAENTLYFYPEGKGTIGIGGVILFPGDSILVKTQECMELVNSSSEKVTLIKVIMTDLND